MARLKRFFVEALHFKEKPKSSTRILQQAATAILDRSVDRAACTAEVAEKRLCDHQVDERTETRIYHDRKKLAIFLGMIVAAILLLTPLGL